MRVVAVLLCRTSVAPMPDREGRQAAGGASADRLPETGAVGTGHARAHHAHAPQQQGHPAADLDQDVGRVHRQVPAVRYARGA